MATGIVSVAAQLHGRPLAARGLFWLNIAAYVLLWVLTLIRFIRFRAHFIGGLTRHSRGAAYLTMAAGTCVLGSQFALLSPWIGVAKTLWLIGMGLWLALSYAFFVAMTVGDRKPRLEDGINGAWLLVVVAPESVSVLGCMVAPSFASANAVLFVALAAHLVGTMLCVFFATLILYRWMFFSMAPGNVTPDYWINMGALAISTLAGTLLLKAANSWGLLQTVAPFLVGSAILFWAAGNWWIPLLLILELWRHTLGRVPLAYSPQYWSVVFPLGTYATATFMLADVTGLAFLHPIAKVFFYAALLAWVVTLAGMIRKAARSRLAPGCFLRRKTTDG
jgi:tellurite resistance protein TehA-like permease